jgi:hypothetical protein
MVSMSTLPDRIDFTLTRSCVVVTKFWSVDGRSVAPNGAQVEPTSFDLDAALDWCKQHGYSVRRWRDGARAWRGDRIRPMRSRRQIEYRRMKAEQRAIGGDSDGTLLSLDFAFEG